MIIIRNVIISFIFLFSSFAVENLSISSDAANLLSEIRCITCTGQNVAGSQSDFAIMIKKYVLYELKNGKTPSQVKQNLVSIYGEEILMTPAITLKNILLWAAPLVILLGCGLYILKLNKH